MKAFRKLAEHHGKLAEALLIYSRLKAVDAALRSPEGLNAQALAESLGCDKRSIQRDMATLAATVGEIISESIKGNQYDFRRRYKGKPQRLFAPAD